MNDISWFEWVEYMMKYKYQEKDWIEDSIESGFTKEELF